MNDTTTDFDWGRLGEPWWRAAAKDVGARDQQVKFACAIHRGCSRTEAARQAGYAGDADDLRSNASRAFKTNTVQGLLALATAEGKGGPDGNVDGDEARRILSGLARGSDPLVRIRALESLAKLDERQRELGRAPEDDGFGEWRMARDFLRRAGGGAAFLHLYLGSSGWLVGLPLFHDVRAAVKREDPALWNRIYERGSPASRAHVDQLEADPEWQLEARRQLWREVGVEIEPPRTNGHAAHGTEANQQAVVHEADVAA